MHLCISPFQSLSCVQLFATPWTAACQALLSITNSQNLLKLMPIELVMPSNHLILCCPLLLPPLIFPSIRVFSNESFLHITWPKYSSFSLFWLIHLYKNLHVPLHYNMHVILKHQFSSIKGLIRIWKAIFPSSQRLSSVPYLLMP